MADGDSSSVPVRNFKVLLVSAAGDSTFAPTDGDGIARTALPPGRYRIARHQVAEFDGVRYSWEMPLVITRDVSTVSLSQQNARVVDDPQ